MHGDDIPELEVVVLNIGRMMEALQQLNEFGSTAHGIERIAYSEEERKAKEYLMEQCRRIGMETRIDPVGNVIARLPGTDPNLPAVAVGSHLDTVYSGGRYDGALGIAAGLEIVRSLADEKVRTLHPIELICFACEESAKFGFATLGSKAMAGNLQPDVFHRLKSKDGVPIEQVFREQGLDVGQYRQAARGRQEIKVFFELHIEQGPRLIESRKPIGIVTGIAAPLRLSVTIEGRSAHSGATGMRQRRDALLAASELALEIERLALSEERHNTVATVGVLDVYPGSMNVVPGQAKLKVDIRSINAESRDRVRAGIIKAAERLEAERKVRFALEVIQEEAPVLMDADVMARISETCDELGLDYMRLPSGGGHDAMNMAARWPAGLIFVPSVGGISHHPDEFTEQSDIEAGVMLLERLVRKEAIVIGREARQDAAAEREHPVQ